MSLSSPACMRNAGPMRYPCPCCGHLVFGGPPGSFEICSVCFWEDDASELEFATTCVGGANGIALAEAQRNYTEFGACEAASVRSVRPPLADEPRDSLWRPVDPGRDSFPAWGSGDRAPEHDETLYYWRPTFWRNRSSTPAST
jgi:hypothetical protein